MKKSKFVFLCIVLMSLVQSCNAAFIKISDKSYEATDASRVELYFSKMPNRDYEEIGFVHLDIANNSTDFDKLRKAAAKIGANAIIQIRGNPGINGIAVRWK